MDSKEAVFLVDKLLQNSIHEQNLSDTQETVLRQSLLGLSYQEIADRSGYDRDYIKQTGAKLWRSLSLVLNKKVTKSNIRNVLDRYCQEQQIRLSDHSQAIDFPRLPMQPRQDWGDAIDVQTFFGRESELSQCKSWILERQSRVVNISGMGGVGKTAIASKLARDIAGEFKYTIWRSLRNAPSFIEIISDLVLFVSGQQQVKILDSTDADIACLMKYLANTRCLLILDNLESILRSGETGGSYRSGYEAYGQLLRRIADENHQSCLIITSREQPIGMSSREGEVVRSLQLSGLSVNAAQAVLKTKQIADSQRLVELYQGNPLALKIAATTIKYLFNGDVGEFLTQGLIIFGDIWDLLEQQFARLSQQERAVMYWLAINREWVTLSQLRRDYVPTIPPRQLLETMESLQRRSLIEVSNAGFIQQPVVMEYITEKLIDVFVREISTGEIELLRTHPLIKAQDKDYLREAQVRLILQPVLEQLFFSLKEKHQIERQLQDILQQLRLANSIEAEYAVGNIINLLKYLKVDLAGWDFSHLQVWQADFRGINLQGVNFAHADLANSVFAHKMGCIFAVDFSPDEKLLATGDDERIKIWQMPEGKQILTLPGHDAPPVWTLTFSPDGKIIASGSSDRTVRLWDVATGQCLQILSGHQGSIWALAFSPDSTVLASGSEDGKIKLWRVKTGAEIITLQGKNPTLVSALAFHPAGKLLAVANLGKGVTIWQTTSDLCFQEIPTDTSQPISLAFSPNGQFLAVSSPQGMIRLWNTATQQWQANLRGHYGQLEDLDFSADSKTLASSSIDATIRLWQIPEARCTRVLQGHRARITSISLAAKSQILASSSEDGSLRIWDILTGKCLRVIAGYSDRVWSIAFSPDGKILASANETGVVRLWNISTANYQELEHPGRVKSVAFSPDGKILASVTYNYQIKLWNLASGECIRTIEEANNWCWSIAFSPDGQTLATSGGDNKLRCWDLKTGNPVGILPGHQGSTLDVVFLSQDKLHNTARQPVIASTSMDKTVKLWNLNPQKCDRTLQHEAVVWSIAYHPAQNLLATGSEDGKVKLWHLDTGECFATLTGHTQLIISLDFNADGSLVASGSNDRRIRLWDVATRKCVQTINAHQDSVFGVAFSSQSNVLASGSHDRTVKLWNIETGKCLKVFQTPKIYEGMNIKRATGLTEAQTTMLKALGSID